MAQLTPKDILEISESIEAIYQRTVDDLLINIARHFQITGWERTRYWEIKKLSEMGALTKESAAIIAKNTGMAPAEIEKAFLQVSEKACLDIDPQLKDAAAKGILQDPGTSATTSPLLRQAVQGYVDQATDTLNMVNSTMLESTLRAYQQAVHTAVNEAMIQEAKELLEASALEVVTGQETKVRAIRKAMDQLARAGIPGFYDKAGRAWSPDGYVAMVIRTTSHNAAIAATRNRQIEYGGGDIFQVSSHPGARPLCYPYQGKFFSWSSGPGEFTDGAGRTQHYDNINDSSYGEPAGLFGINCGHHPIPMIPGYSYPQDQIEETPEENAKEYEESQKQRQYERQVREAKRDLAVAEATGDEEAIKAARQKVAQEQAKIRAYTKETGRVRRYDREQIGSTRDTDYGMRDLRRQKVDEPLSGGTRKAAAKQTWTEKYTPATTTAEAEAFAKSMGVRAVYTGVDIDVANAMNEAIAAAVDYHPDALKYLASAGSGQAVNKELKKALVDYYLDDMSESLASFGITGEAAVKRAEKWASKSVGRIDGSTLAYARRTSSDVVKGFDGIFVNDKFGKKAQDMLDALARAEKAGYHPVDCATIKSAFDHEMGHILDYVLQVRSDPEMQRLYRSMTKAEISAGLSEYGSTKIAEFIAEGYAEYRNSPAPRKIARDIFAIIDKKAKAARGVK